jgi:hypothetical protein
MKSGLPEDTVQIDVSTPLNKPSHAVKVPHHSETPSLHGTFDPSLNIDINNSKNSDSVQTIQVFSSTTQFILPTIEGLFSLYLMYYNMNVYTMF